MIPENERIFTTFEVAKICRVYHTTVINWVNKDKLKAYYTPGGHRRIHLSHLLEFMTKFELPIPAGLNQKLKRIFVVEDDRACRLLIVDSLKELKGVEVLECDNGLAALIEIGNEAPDLLVMDIGIPGIDGLGVCKLLASNEHTRQIHVIAVTGKEMSKADRDYLKAHTDAFFTKPFDVDALVSSAAEMLSLPPSVAA